MQQAGKVELLKPGARLASASRTSENDLRLLHAEDGTRTATRGITECYFACGRSGNHSLPQTIKELNNSFHGLINGAAYPPTCPEEIPIPTCHTFVTSAPYSLITVTPAMISSFFASRPKSLRRASEMASMRSTALSRHLFFLSIARCHTSLWSVSSKADSSRRSSSTFVTTIRCNSRITAL